MAFTGPARRLTDGDTGSRRIDRLLYRLRGLRMIGTVLHVGTHPDDEDAGLIAYMSRKYGARTVYWSATRGESGQNRLGSYAGDALGIYRTWESLAARAIDGGESLYGPFYDFGYCINPEEAVAKWGRHELVREVVRAVRLVQPQVMIARYTGTTADGHCQHQAIGSATLDAFDAAADPTLFRELGLPAWRTPKLYQSTSGDWQPGEHNALGKLQSAFERDGFVRIDTGEDDPVAGVSYQQLAWLAFNCHRTQAMGFLPEPGSFYYYYLLKKSHVETTPREASFYDGLDPTLPGLVDFPGGGPSELRDELRAICGRVDSALLQLRPDDPAAAAGPLLEALELLRRLRAATDDSQALARQLDYKIASFEDVIVGCLGVDVECLAERAHVAAGERVRLRGTLWNPRAVRIDDCRFTISVPDGWSVTPIATRDVPCQVDYDVFVAPDARPTTPSWLTEAHNSYRYNVPIGNYACEPLDSTPVALECGLVVEGQRLTVRRPALRREAFAGGYRELPISVLPAVSVRPQVRRVFLPVGLDEREVDVDAAIRRHVDQCSHATRLQLAIPPGWSVSPPGVELPPGATDDVTTARFRVTVPGGMPAGRYRIEYLIGAGDARPAVTLEPVWMGAPGLPRDADAATCIREAFLRMPSQVDVAIMSARFARGLNYAYVRGADEGLLDALSHFDLSIYTISDKVMSYRELSDFDAIVIGPNAYLIREELRRNAGRFLDYVARGGTLIVQYQAYGYELHDFAPYPFAYSHPHDRVTSPDGPVTLLEPRHPLMTHPNQITEEDFAGWVHDRGLYFFGTFDDRYTPILACHQPGQGLKRGGFLAAGYGKGMFVYVGYSLFRQVPAGVPGAFRLLANLLALPEALLLERVERLRTVSLFSFMTGEQLMAMARLVSERHAAAGTYLCRQGELGQELFIIIKGDVEIVQHTERGETVVTAREGQVVGEFSILADIPRTADLRALTNVHLLEVSSIPFRALIRQYPEIAEQVIRQLVMKFVVYQREG